MGFTDKNGTVKQLADPGAPIFLDAVQKSRWRPPSPHCTSKVMELTLVYIGDFLGEGCTVSNSQDGNASCTGVADPGDPVRSVGRSRRIRPRSSRIRTAGIAFGDDDITISKEEGGVPKELKLERPSST